MKIKGEWGRPSYHLQEAIIELASKPTLPLLILGKDLFKSCTKNHQELQQQEEKGGNET